MAATTTASTSLTRRGILFKLLFLRPKDRPEDWVSRACIQFAAFETEACAQRLCHMDSTDCPEIDTSVNSSAE